MPRLRRWETAQAILSELAQGGMTVAAGARASARFNAHLRATPEMSAPRSVRQMKRRERRAPSRLAVAPASWTAPAKRSGDGAFARQDVPENFHTPGQSGVALRLPPQSKIAAGSSMILCQTRRSASGSSRRDSLQIARRFNAGNGLAGATNSAGARLWSQTQPQRVASTGCVDRFVRAAAGAAHTAALRMKAAQTRFFHRKCGEN
jgi:hypothetical protein